MIPLSFTCSTKKTKAGAAHRRARAACVSSSSTGDRLPRVQTLTLAARSATSEFPRERSDAGSGIADSVRPHDSRSAWAARDGPVALHTGTAALAETLHPGCPPWRNLGRGGQGLRDDVGRTASRGTRSIGAEPPPGSVRPPHVAARTALARRQCAASRSLRSRMSARASSRCPPQTAAPTAKHTAHSPVRPNVSSSHVPATGAAHTAAPNDML